MDNLTITILTLPLIINELMSSEIYGIIGLYKTNQDIQKRKESENYRLLTFISFNMALASYFYLRNPKIIGIQLVLALPYFYGYYIKELSSNIPNYAQYHQFRKTVYQLTSYILLFGILVISIIYDNITIIAIMLLLYGFFIYGSIHALSTRHSQMEGYYVLESNLPYYFITLSMIVFWFYMLSLDDWANHGINFNRFSALYTYLCIITILKMLNKTYINLP
jgi:hypothetical protein